MRVKLRMLTPQSIPGGQGTWGTVEVSEMNCGGSKEGQAKESSSLSEGPCRLDIYGGIIRIRFLGYD